MRIQQSFDCQQNVLEAAKRRISFVFDHFKDVILSISGGKDSTVLAHLALMEAKRRNRRVGLYFLDEEVVYQSTIDQVAYLMDLMPEHTNRLWLQLEFRLTNASSLTESQLIAWEAGKHEVWMRPRRRDSIQHPMWDRSKETIANKSKGFGFYDVIENFERCFSDTAFLVGLRGAESPNRWRAMIKNPVNIGGENTYWATKKEANVSLYPLFDWNYFDIWRYLAENSVRYCKIYDLQFQKGYPITEMRLSSLIHERAFKSIVDLPEFEPKTYNALLKRIKGISLIQETGKAAKLFRVRKLPQNHKTWQSYRDFLLATYPTPEHKPIFEKRFARQLNNEYVARQQCRQLILNDYENNLHIHNAEDPRSVKLKYYDEVL